MVIQWGRWWLTPKQSCGLLAGTFRAELLEAGEITEGVVTIEDLRDAEQIWLINSVRRWIDVELDLETLPVGH